MHQSNATYQSVSRRKAEMSRHAQQRAQQRGFSQDQIPIIVAYGEPEHDGRGAIRYLMNDKAMARLIRALGRNQRIDGLAGAYVVASASDGTVITIGYRFS